MRSWVLQGWDRIPEEKKLVQAGKNFDLFENQTINAAETQLR